MLLPEFRGSHDLRLWPPTWHTYEAPSAGGQQAFRPTDPVSSLPVTTAERPKRKRGKIPKPATDYLEDWLHRHSDHPYPNEDEKMQLCQATGLSMSQVSNWMINACHFLPCFVPNSRSYLAPPSGPASDSCTCPACASECSRLT